MRFRWFRPFDHVPLAGLAGLMASLTLDRISQLVGIGVGIVSMGYVGTKWFLLYKVNQRILHNPLSGLPPFPPTPCTDEKETS